MSDDRSAALLVRVWLEDSAGGFRARVTALGGRQAADVTIALASTRREVMDAVSDWLDRFARPERESIDDGP